MNNQLARTKLNQQWLLWAITSLIVTLVGYLFLQQRWEPIYVNRWLILTLIAMAAQSAILRWGLKYNYRTEDSQKLLPTLGYGNGLTLTRGLLICVLVGFLFSPRSQNLLLAWLPTLLYMIAAILDLFDGYVARITRHSTKLGEILDIEFDGVGLLVMIGICIQYGQLPLWYLVIGMARQLFLLGMWIRERQSKPNHDLPPSDNRRLTAGYQMGFISAISAPLFTSPATTIASLIFGGILAGGFLRDWLIVSGLVDSQSSRYQFGRRWIKQLSEQWLPVLLRTIAPLLILWIVWQQLPDFADWRGALAEPGIAGPIIPIIWIFLFLSPIALILFFLGILSRLSAYILLSIPFSQIFTYGFDWQTSGILLAALLLVTNLGSGAYALWPIEERILRKRAGERAKIVE